MERCLQFTRAEKQQSKEVTQLQAMKTGSKHCPAKAKASSCFLTKEEKKKKKKNVIGKALNNDNYSNSCSAYNMSTA